MAKSTYYRLEAIYRVARAQFLALVRQRPQTHSDYCANLSKVQIWKEVMLEASYGMRQIQRSRS
jgi:hypothetical protein